MTSSSSSSAVSFPSVNRSSTCSSTSFAAVHDGPIDAADVYTLRCRRRRLSITAVSVSVVVLMFLDVVGAATVSETYSSAEGHLLKRLRNYELSVPTLVDESYEFLSYDITRRGVVETVPGYHRHQQQPNRHDRNRRDVTFASSSDDKSSEVFTDNSLTNADGNHDWIYYRLSAFGRTFHFNVTLNRWLVGPSFRVEYWNADGPSQFSTADEEHARDCYYVGYLAKQEVTSRVAISNCHGLSGIFTTEDEEYFVEPLWNSATTKTGQLHVIYKRSDIQDPPIESECDSTRQRILQTISDHGLQNAVDGVSDDVYETSYKTMTEDVHIEVNEPLKKRFKRSVSNENFVETLVVVDKTMTEYHGLGQIQAYILTVMNVVARLYRDASIGNDVNIVVTKIIVLTEDQPNLEISYHADKSLNSFCSWQQTTALGNRSATEPQANLPHDNAILITRYDICTYRDQPCGTLGLAPMGGMCEADRSCSIIEDIGIASAFTIAHETGHSFGMQHDGLGNNCGTVGHEPAKLMAAQLSNSADPFSWSSCSREYITAFLDSGKGSCLENSPWQQHQSGIANHSSPSLQFPGETHSADAQCRHRFGADSQHCKKDVDICRELWCYNATSHCTSANIPALDGTSCHMHHSKLRDYIGWCYRGSCVKQSWKPKAVDGQWGEWSYWSPCSRSCGGGISYSERLCNRPRPVNNGKYCIGERKQYRSCNIHPCPENATDFRELQCSKFNNEQFRGKYYRWKPFYPVNTGNRSINPCILNCVAIGYQFYAERAGKVVDGTRCSPHSLDVCISGKCYPVGCDGILGSNAVEDNCRICHGNNTGCQTIRGTVDSSLYPPGTDSYVNVVEIPKGATYIRIGERNASQNYLALRSATNLDNYYINGAWTIDWPKQFEVAGTLIKYERPVDGPEKLFAVGPTNESLVVMLLLQEKNVVIDYEYSVGYRQVDSSGLLSPTVDNVEQRRGSKQNVLQRVENTVNEIEGINNYADVTYTTDAADLLRIPNVIMAVGRQVLVVNKTNVPSSISREAESNAGVTLTESYDWHYTASSSCSRTCGRGSVRLSLTCVNKRNNTRVPNNMCQQPQPSTNLTEYCNETPCPAEWRISAWSSCTKPCLGGHRSRSVLCVRFVEMNREAEVVRDEECSTPKPKTKTKCNDEKCLLRWSTENWTECWPPCGRNSSRSRMVRCLAADGTELTDDRCAGLKRPSKREQCTNLPTCPDPVWATGAWSECSVSCGTGQQMRSVACRTQYGEPSSYCNINNKPADIQSCQLDCAYVDLKFASDDGCIDVDKITYCQLVLKFQFCNRPYFRQMCCNTCRSHTAVNVDQLW